MLGRRYEKIINDETISYTYADKNILEETKTNISGEYKKTYINGIGLDNLVAYIQEEPDLSYEEQEELLFCELRVLPYETEFNNYSWTTLTTRCNDLSASGSIIVENTYYFTKNHLGSIDGIFDEDGNIISEYKYDSFGNFELVNGYDIGNTRLFTGREYDKEIGLYYLRARYYDSNLGRFISRDPIGQTDDVNLYAYVGNNSVMFTDPTGTVKKLYLVLFDPEEHYKRNILNTGLPNSEVEALKNGWTLLNEYQTAYHNSNAPIFDFNKKYISKDGHKEVVFDYKTGIKITNPEDMGSYNYFNPKTNPFEHFIYDTIPYFIYGNSDKDNTSKFDRVLKTFNLVPAGINVGIENINETIYVTENSINNFNQIDFINNFIIYAR